MSFLRTGRRTSVRRAIKLCFAFSIITSCSQPDGSNLPLDVDQTVSRSIAPGYRAYDMEWAIIVAPNDDIASTFAEEVRAAAASFYISFGIRIPRGCVRVLGDTTLPQCGIDAAWSMDWPSYSVVEKHSPGSPYWRLVSFGYLRDNEINRAAADLGSRAACDAGHHPIVHATTLRHELMHQFFIKLLWPNSKGSDQYGGDAPDWLDEAAAIAGEPPYLIRARRARFMQMLEGGTVIPMRHFLRMEHPILASIRAAPLPEREGQWTVSIRRQSKESDEAVRLLDYYAQVRALSDYLAATSTRNRVLRQVTAQLKNAPSSDQLGDLRGDDRQIEAGFIAWVKQQNWTSDDSVCL